MTCFTVSEAERSLAVALGIPLYGVDPELLWLGTKSGSRWAFRKAGVPLLPGAEDLKSEADLVHAIDGLVGETEHLERVVVKHNTGFSGHGNAILDLSTVHETRPRSGTSREGREQALSDALRAMRFVDERHTWESFLAKFEQGGGIVEAFLESPEKRAPSCQLRILANREPRPHLDTRPARRRCRRPNLRRMQVSGGCGVSNDDPARRAASR